jgi:DNA-directed RNA polymerase subunit RPC12/RpoP
MENLSSLELERYYCPDCDRTMGRKLNEAGQVVCLTCTQVLCQTEKDIVYKSKDRLFCGNCQTTFEKIETDKEAIKCPQCKQEKGG